MSESVAFNLGGLGGKALRTKKELNLELKKKLKLKKNLELKAGGGATWKYWLEKASLR